MSLSLVIALILIGIVLILLEIFFLPGMVSGILGLGSVIVGISFSYISHGDVIGHIVLASTIVVLVSLLVILFKSNSWKKLSLSDIIDSKVNVVDDEKLKKNDVGTTITKLVPSGKAIFNGNTFEVHSLSGIIDNNSQVVVVKIEGYKIFVNPINK